MFSSASWRKNWNLWSFDEPCRWHLWLRTEGFERKSKQGTGFPCPESYKIPTCALCHFVPFWLPPQARKNFCGNSIIKQQVLGLNVPGGVFIPLSVTLSSQTFPPHGQQLCRAHLYCPLGLYFYLIGNGVPAEVLLFILSCISKLVSPSVLTLAILCGFSWTSKA